MRKTAFLLLSMLVWAAPALAAEPETVEPETVELEALEVTAPKDTTERITQTEIERKSAGNLFEAVQGTPGVYELHSGGRSESAVSIRGSNRYQVGMYVDGVPVSTVYRGEYDYSSISVFDLESIDIYKGYSSPLFQHYQGLAGVINVRTAKPQKELEFAAKYTNFFDRTGDDQGRFFGLGLGTRQDKYYLQAEVMHDEQDFFSLSHDFSGGINQSGHRRNNSDYKNQRLNFKAGFTPTEDWDIMVGYTNQRFEKGQPPQAAADGRSYDRYWRWDDYDTERYYANIDWHASDLLDFRLVLYRDEHTDATHDYTDASFSMLENRPGTPNVGHPRIDDRNSIYEQYTTGGQFITDFTFSEAHKLSAALGYRKLEHEETRVFSDDSQRHTNEDTVEAYYDAGLEYTWQATEPLTVVLGAGYTHMEPDHARIMSDDFPSLEDLKGSASTSLDMFTYQAGLFYDFTENHQGYLTLARKERAATMRERYYTMMTDEYTLANPNLDPESAYHFELGYRGTLNNWLKLNAAAYYSKYEDMIVSADNLNDYDGEEYGAMMVNADKVDIYGLDLGAEAMLTGWLSLGATASFLDWNVSDATVKRLEIPHAQGSLYAVLSPLDGLSIVPEMYMRAGTYETTGEFSIPGFTTFNLKAAYDVTEQLTLEAGVKNLLDKNRYYSYYYPQAGMTFFTGVKFTY